MTHENLIADQWLDKAVFERARERIHSYILKTPLIHCSSLDGRGRVFLKLESTQVTNSFKVRGAFNMALQVEQKKREKGFYTLSSGNFASACAWVARSLRVPATVLMLPTSSATKRAKTQMFGGKVLTWEQGVLEGQEHAEQMAKEFGGVYLPPYDHPDIIAGQGTAGLEIAEDLPSISHFFCPVGGGGLMAGCAAALKQHDPAVQVVACEPSGGDDFVQSLSCSERITLSRVETVADGLRTPSVGIHNWPVLKECVDKAVSVSEEAILDAMRLIYKTLYLKVEPSAAVSVAAMMQQSDLKGDVVCMISGGNISDEDYFKLIGGI